MSNIDVGEGWRRLEPGEVILDGDQYWSWRERVWFNTGDVGRVIKRNDCAYRRHIAGGAQSVTLRERTPGEAAAYVEGMNARMVNDLIRERDEARAECRKLSAANHALDGVATVLEARVSELKAELKLAKESSDGGFSNQPAISGAEKSGDSGNQEPVKYAVVVGGEMRNTVYDHFSEARDKASDIACRGTPHFVGVVALYREPPGGIPAPLAGGEAKQEPMAWGYKGEAWFDGNRWNEKREVTTDEQVAKFKDKDAVPLYAAPQSPRGWLTEEDRRAVAFAAKAFRGHTIIGPLKENADQLDALLARETPPKVKVPPMFSAKERDAVIAAMLAAGVEVE